MLSIIVTCDCNRDPLVTLRANVNNWKQLRYEIIAVTFGMPSQLNSELRSLGAIVLPLKEQPFNKSLGINLGVAISRGENLFFLDADVIIKYRALKSAITVLDAGYFATVKKVSESEKDSHSVPPARNLVSLSFPRKTVDVVTRTNFRDGSRSGPGLIFMQRQWFLDVQGMNSQLTGWGWEDIDLICRLQIKLGLNRKEIGAALHLSHHNSTLLTANHKQQSELANMKICLERYRKFNFEGTYSDDVFNAAFLHDKLSRSNLELGDF